MKTTCIKVEEFGNPSEVLKVGVEVKSELKENEVLVRMLSRPINPSDLEAIKGVLSAYFKAPSIPGFEGVGVIEEVGPLASKELIGKRVLPLRGEGTWQEFVKTQDKFVVPIPDLIDDHTAGQLYVNPLSAWVLCTDVFKLNENSTLVVDACGSSLGRIFAQLAKIIGFRLIAVTRNNKHTEELLELGASYVLDSSIEPIKETILKLTNNTGADAAVDCIGGSVGNEIAESVRQNGYFRSVAFLSGAQLDWVTIKSRVDAEFFFLGKWTQEVSLEKWHATFNELINLFDEGKIKLMDVHATFDLEDIQKAIETIEGSEVNKGKVILTSK